MNPYISVSSSQFPLPNTAEVQLEGGWYLGGGVVEGKGRWVGGGGKERILKEVKEVVDWFVPSSTC